MTPSPIGPAPRLRCSSGGEDARLATALLSIALREDVEVGPLRSSADRLLVDHRRLWTGAFDTRDYVALRAQLNVVAQLVAALPKSAASHGAPISHAQGRSRRNALKGSWAARPARPQATPVRQFRSNARSLCLQANWRRGRARWSVRHQGPHVSSGGRSRPITRHFTVWVSSGLECDRCKQPRCSVSIRACDAIETHRRYRHNSTTQCRSIHKPRQPSGSPVTYRPI